MFPKNNLKVSGYIQSEETLDRSTEIFHIDLILSAYLFTNYSLVHESKSGKYYAIY
jgi:hypothetical protein